MNSSKKGEGVLLLNFEGGLGVPLWNFEGGPGVSLLNFEGGPRSQGPGLTFTPCLFPCEYRQESLTVTWFSEKSSL